MDGLTEQDASKEIKDVLDMVEKKRIIRRRRKLPSKATLTVGLLLLLIPILFEIILVAGFLMGGGPS